MNALVPNIRHEVWLAQKICKTRIQMLFEGITDVAQRRASVRQAIVFRQLADVFCANRGGKSMTFAEAFAQLYGEPL